MRIAIVVVLVIFGIIALLALGVVYFAPPGTFVSQLSVRRVSKILAVDDNEILELRGGAIENNLALLAPDEHGRHAIPKRIVMCGNNELLTPEIRKSIASLRAMNPEYTFEYYDDIGMERWMKENMPSDVNEAYAKLLLGVMRADFFRYCIIFVKGGVYLDLKSGVSKPLREILRSGDEMLIGQWGGWRDQLPIYFESMDLLRSHYPICYHASKVKGGEFCQWFVVAARGHPCLREVIQRVTHNILVLFPQVYSSVGGGASGISDRDRKTYFENRHGVLICTGPIAFTIAVKAGMEKDPGRVRYLGTHSETNTFGFVYEMNSFNQGLAAQFKNHLARQQRTKNHYTRHSGPVVEISAIDPRGQGPDLFTPKSSGGNNCLFDAVIAATRLTCPKTGKLANSQALREACDQVLIRDGLPVIPKGQPAGEGYLQAISDITRMKIGVYKKSQKIATIKHSSVPDQAPEFKLIHHGDNQSGHWTS